MFPLSKHIANLLFDGLMQSFFDYEWFYEEEIKREAAIEAAKKEQIRLYNEALQWQQEKKERLKRLKQEYYNNNPHLLYHEGINIQVKKID